MLVFALLPAGAAAATFPVTSTGDGGAPEPKTDGNCASTALEGACTLRAAIEEANGSPGDDEITFTLPAPSTIATNGTEIAITAAGKLTITGPGRLAHAARQICQMPQ